MNENVTVRIAITVEEWRELRKLALDRGVSAGQLVAELVRDALAAAKA